MFRFLFQLLEKVLGPNHLTVMSTLDCLAEVCTVANHEPHALKYYTEYLDRLYEQDAATEPQATTLFKMSKVHSKQNDLESQLNKLHLAVKTLRSDTMTKEGKELERHIQVDLRLARQELEKQELEWV
jgi:hypothetical protein